MVAKVLGHMRGHFIAYIALFVALGGTAVAAPMALRGNGEISFGAAAAQTMNVDDWNSQGQPVGPTALQLTGLGDLKLHHCLTDGPPGSPPMSGTGVGVSFTNTSSSEVVLSTQRLDSDGTPYRVAPGETLLF